MRGVEENSETGELEAGRRRPMNKLSPKEPSEEERREHDLTHLPFRNWCRHCVRGRGKEEPCRRSGRGEAEVPEIHVDFMFMGEERGGHTLTFLVAKERGSKALMPTAAPKKSSGEWLAKRGLAWVREVGC